MPDVLKGRKAVKSLDVKDLQNEGQFRMWPFCKRKRKMLTLTTHTRRGKLETRDDQQKSALQEQDFGIADLQ